MTGAPTADLTGADAARPLVVVLTGESNSGGIGENADAAASELGPRDAVRILNVTAHPFSFEPLQLGRNNLRDHAGLEEYYDTCHGMENGLAHAVEAGVFAPRRTVYLVKTGQGGSTIGEWAPDHVSGYWKKHEQRIASARRELPENPLWVVWFSLGINDAIAGTDLDQWRAAVVAHLRRLKAQLSGAVILMTQFQSMKQYAPFDAAIATLAEKEPGVHAVSSAGAGLRDANHWNYSGLKTLARRMAEITSKALDSVGE